MSLIRISFGVLVGVLVLIGLVVVADYLNRHFPTATHRIFCSLMGLGGGSFFVWGVHRCLRLGYCGGRYTAYRRDVHPFHFWFYICFYSLLGTFFLAFGYCSIFAPKLLSLR